MEDFEAAVQCTKAIVDLRKEVIPKIVSMENKRMDLEVQRLVDWSDQLAGSHPTVAPPRDSFQQPEITPWSPPFNANKLLSEFDVLKRLSHGLKS